MKSLKRSTASVGEAKRMSVGLGIVREIRTTGDESDRSPEQTGMFYLQQDSLLLF